MAMCLLWATTAVAGSNGQLPVQQQPRRATTNAQTAGSYTPTLVRRQQRTEAKLKKIWSQRNVPAGMQPPQAHFRPRDSGVRAVSLLAQNVDLRLTAGIGYHINHIEAALIPHKAGAPVNFDNPWSYTIHIYNGQIRLQSRQIDALFNHYILAYTPRSVTHVDSTITQNSLKIELGARLWGVFPPLGALPTTLAGTIAVTDDNRLRYTPQRVTSLGLPLLPVLNSLGLQLSALTPLHRHGVVLDGDTLFINLEKAFPPPQITFDNLSSATLTNKGLVLTFSSTSNPVFSTPPVTANSYLWMQSGDAKFFDAVLVNVHLEVLNAASDAPLDFNLYDYRAQTAAGRIFLRRNGTLIVKVPNAFPTGTLSAQYPDKARQTAP